MVLPSDKTIRKTLRLALAGAYPKGGWAHGQNLLELSRSSTPRPLGRGYFAWDVAVGEPFYSEEILAFAEVRYPCPNCGQYIETED